MTGYKSVIFNVLVLASAILGLNEFQTLFTSSQLLGIFAVINVVLRAVTSTPIFNLKS